MSRSQAQVLWCKFISPTVKYFHLQDLNVASGCQQRSFKAGQWLDVFIPNTADVIGGYSMSSPPSLFEKSGQFDLAIKKSDTYHAATEWMINQCEEKTVVEYGFGGTVFYDEQSISTPRPLLLIAGGVGINPIYSILQAALENQSALSVALLYSAKSFAELIYKEQIEELAKSHTKFYTKFLITQSPSEQSDTNFGETSSSSDLKYGFHRLTKDDLKEAIKTIGTTELKCYICGPDKMLTECQDHVSCMGVDSKNIFYERWW